MKKIKLFFRNQTLMWKIAALFAVLIVLATGINTYLTYQNNMKMYLDEKSAQSQKLANYLRDTMEKKADTKWLLHYWKENYKQMDIVYDDENQTTQKYHLFSEQNPQIDINCVTGTELEKLPPKAQKLYAEAAYMKLTNEYSTLKETYKPAYLFCFYPQSDSTLFYYVTGVVKGEKRGDSNDTIFSLGGISSYQKKQYPVLTNTWETGQVQKELEQPVKTGASSGYYHVYAPVTLDGKTECLIGVTLETNSVKNELKAKLLRVELISSICFLFCGILLLLMVRRIVLIPLAFLQKCVQEYQKTKDAKGVAKHLLHYQSESEIGQLSKAFSKLTLEIEQYIDNMQSMAARQERLKTELDLATKIQEDMLPRDFIDDNEIELYATMHPAKEVGGDFYDFFYVDDNHIALVIGDVSGKGVPAALFMASSKNVIRNYALAGLSPENVFMAANKELCQANHSQLFTTAWFGLYEVSSGRLLYTEAGHENPICIRRDGTTEYIKPVKKKMVLGGIDSINYVLSEDRLYPGDTLVLYTDGVPEAMNAKEEFFGLERFVQVLKELRKENTKELLHHVQEQITSFVDRAEAFDDVTMLAFRRKEKKDGE